MATKLFFVADVFNTDTLVLKTN